jgi:hypothetical protein
MSARAFASLMSGNLTGAGFYVEERTAFQILILTPGVGIYPAR